MPCCLARSLGSLNESPRPKAGKSPCMGWATSCYKKASMKVPARRRGNGFVGEDVIEAVTASMKVPARRRGNIMPFLKGPEGTPASMKVPARRRGNTHPKLARNYAAETSALREPRGRPTQKVYPSSHSGIQTLLTSQNITRATRQDYVTCQVLAETDKASKGHYPHLCYLSAIELVIPPLPCRASLANESSTRLENERIRFGYLARPANVAEGRLVKPGQQPQVAEEH